jgi:F-type H+-transporting ATPase subunit alpha
LTELLKQPQFRPIPAEKQVIILFAGTQGYLDDMKVDQIRAFEDGLYPYLDSAQSQLLNDIATKKALDDDLRSRIHAALKEYKQNFLAEHEGAKLKQSAVQLLNEQEKKKEQAQSAAQPVGAVR